MLRIGPLTNKMNGKRINQNNVRCRNEYGNAVLKEIIEMKVNLVKYSLKEASSKEQERENSLFLFLLLTTLLLTFHFYLLTSHFSYLAAS